MFQKSPEGRCGVACYYNAYIKGRLTFGHVHLASLGLWLVDSVVYRRSSGEMVDFLEKSFFFGICPQSLAPVTPSFHLKIQKFG